VANKDRHVAEDEDMSVDLSPVPEMITPATTWDNLEWVATPSWIELKRASTMKVKTYVDFVSLLPYRPTQLTLCRFGNLHKPLVDRQAIKDAVMKSTIEVLLLKERRHPLQELSEIPTDFRWPKDIALGTDNRKPVVKFPDEATEKYLVNILLSKPESETIKGEASQARTLEADPLTTESLEADLLTAESLTTDPIKRASTEEVQVKAGHVKELEGQDEKASGWTTISIYNQKLKFAVSAIRPDLHIIST
jgi:hypothetical protein